MRRILPHIILLAALAVGALTIEAGAQRPAEHQVKAAVVLKFARFVYWPEAAFPDSNAPLIIVVLGRDPIGASLEKMVDDPTAHDRPLRIVRIDRVEDLPTCHILFISSSENRRLGSILKAVATRPILTVSDMEWFARGGGAIRLGFDEERLRLRINLKAVEKTGLKISSRLLQLAEIVGGQP